MRELLPLIERDYLENGVHNDRVPFALDLDAYLDYDLLGTLQIITARDDGILIGYLMALVSNKHIDHATVRWAILSWYWIFPEYRNQGIGQVLFITMLDFLKTAGVRVVEGSEKLAHKHGLFERLKFEATDTLYRKVLED